MPNTKCGINVNRTLIAYCDDNWLGSMMVLLLPNRVPLFISKPSAPAFSVTRRRMLVVHTLFRRSPCLDYPEPHLIAPFPSCSRFACITWLTPLPFYPSADAWPQVFDDSCAHEDWGWRHDYDLSAMCKIMIDDLRAAYGSGNGTPTWNLRLTESFRTGKGCGHF